MQYTVEIGPSARPILPHVIDKSHSRTLHTSLLHQSRCFLYAQVGGTDFFGLVITGFGLAVRAKRPFGRLRTYTSL